MERQRVSGGTEWERTVGYSRAVRAGSQVHVAGTVAVDEDGEPLDAGPYEQAARALEILTDALAEAGADPGEVVRTRAFVTDADDWEAIGRAHGEAFGDVRPAMTLVEVAGLVDPRLCVEFEATAVVG
jgi:enamine deaminase RidA (YjgF/YER057c/UK114 family)